MLAKFQCILHNVLDMVWLGKKWGYYSSAYENHCLWIVYNFTNVLKGTFTRT